jgi:hypothetical protein
MQIDLNQAATVVSLVLGIVSIVVSFLAIIDSRLAAKESAKSFEATRDALSTQTAHVKDLLSEVDKKAAVIEETVKTAQTKLLDMTIDIVKGRERCLSCP